MDIDLLRIEEEEAHTLGLLFLDGEFECFTMEDCWRKEKIAGVTAIPEGVYTVTLRKEGNMLKRYEPTFDFPHPGMLWLRDVPDFEWVYIHIGNTPKDSKGCILVAQSHHRGRSHNFIGSSALAYKQLYPRVCAVIEAGEPVTMKITSKR